MWVIKSPFSFGVHSIPGTHWQFLLNHFSTFFGSVKRPSVSGRKQPVEKARGYIPDLDLHRLGVSLAKVKCPMELKLASNSVLSKQGGGHGLATHRRRLQ